MIRLTTIIIIAAAAISADAATLGETAANAEIATASDIAAAETRATNYTATAVNEIKPSVPVTSATLAWQSNGSAIVVNVQPYGTLAATLTGWTEGQSQTAIITLAAGCSIDHYVKLVGYGSWPTGNQFLASATRVGGYVYVTPIIVVN